MKTNIMLAFVLVASVAIAGCVGQSPTGGSTDSSATTGLNVGNLAPTFVVQDIDGRDVSIQEFTDKPTMLFFTATWCPRCKRTASQLKPYYTSTGEAFRVLVIGIDPTERPEQIRQWKEQNGHPNWIYIQSPDLGITYNTRSIDWSYVIDRSGVIRYVGGAPNADEAIRGLI